MLRNARRLSLTSALLFSAASLIAACGDEGDSPVNPDSSVSSADMHTISQPLPDVNACLAKPIVGASRFNLGPSQKIGKSLLFDLALTINPACGPFELYAFAAVVRESQALHMWYGLAETTFPGNLHMTYPLGWDFYGNDLDRASAQTIGAYIAKIGADGPGRIAVADGHVRISLVADTNASNIGQSYMLPLSILKIKIGATGQIVDLMTNDLVKSIVNSDEIKLVQ